MEDVAKCADEYEVVGDWDEEDFLGAEDPPQNQVPPTVGDEPPSA